MYPVSGAAGRRVFVAWLLRIGVSPSEWFRLSRQRLVSNSGRVRHSARYIELLRAWNLYYREYLLLRAARRRPAARRNRPPRRPRISRQQARQAFEDAFGFV